MRSRAYGLLVGGLVFVTWQLTACTNDDESSDTTTTLATDALLVGIPVGETHEVEINVFCGVDYFPAPVNETYWRMVDIDESFYTYHVPPEWRDEGNTSDTLTVQIKLDSNGERLIATANGKSLTYRPVLPNDPANECN